MVTVVNPLMLKSPLELFVSINNTFDNKFEIENDFTKYFEIFSSVMINISPSNISQLCCCLNYFIKIIRLLLAAVSIKGLTHSSTP